MSRHTLPFDPNELIEEVNNMNGGNENAKFVTLTIFQFILWPC